MEQGSNALQQWIGRSETVSDLVTPFPYAALSATLDRPCERPANGVEVPPLWHWLYFLPIYPQSELGPDGHAKRGGFLPPVQLPRRMWAGGAFTFNAPLCIGDTITRTSTIDNVTEKSGRTGALTFVKVRHDVRVGTADAIALTEYHDIVYREAARPGDPAPAPRAAPARCAWEKRWVPSDVLLFRYSALTFNGHRIHYDRRYVTEVEGYPGLVVHGPMIATLLLDLLRTHLPRERLVEFQFTAVRPTFDINEFFVCGEPEGDGKTIHLWARDHEGWLTMDARARVA
jgi:3-methylfumaryl-CoA hydratase